MFALRHAGLYAYIVYTPHSICIFTSSDLHSPLDDPNSDFDSAQGKNWLIGFLLQIFRVFNMIVKTLKPTKPKLTNLSEVKACY